VQAHNQVSNRIFLDYCRQLRKLDNRKIPKMSLEKEDENLKNNQEILEEKIKRKREK
jgi:hypothetical protein